MNFILLDCGKMLIRWNPHVKNKEISDLTPDSESLPEDIPFVWFPNPLSNTPLKLGFYTRYSACSSSNRSSASETEDKVCAFIDRFL